jgi:RecJ-like exonuclease
MAYWKRLVSGEQDNVLQFWTDVHSNEEIIIVDTSDNVEHKGNYAAFTSGEEKIGVYVEQSDLILDLHEKKDLLVEGSIWSDGEQEFTVIDANPAQRSKGHKFYPQDTDENCVYVEYVDSDDCDWIVEDLFRNSLELVAGEL